MTMTEASTDHKSQTVHVLPRCSPGHGPGCPDYAGRPALRALAIRFNIRMGQLGEFVRLGKIHKDTLKPEN